MSAKQGISLSEPKFRANSNCLYLVATQEGDGWRQCECSRDQVGTKSGLSQAPSRHQVKTLAKASAGAALTDLMAVANRSDRTKFRHQVIQPLMEQGLLEMTPPDKPTSSRQKYRLTEQGAAWLANRATKGPKGP